VTIVQTRIMVPRIHDDGKADPLGVTAERLVGVREKLVGIAPAP
jgi:hypothetical protein